MLQAKVLNVLFYGTNKIRQCNSAYDQSNRKLLLLIFHSIQYRIAIASTRPISENFSFYVFCSSINDNEMRTIDDGLVETSSFPDREGLFGKNEVHDRDKKETC